MSTSSDTPSLDDTVRHMPFATQTLSAKKINDANFTKIGFLLLAGLLSMALWGASAVQLYLYFEVFKKYVKSDKWQLQAYVIFVWVLDGVHQGILCRTVYILFVKRFADVSFLNHIPDNTFTVVILQALIDAPIQALFVMRIWHLSDKSFILTGINALLVLTLFAINVFFFGKGLGFTTFAQLAEIQKFTTALNSLITSVDSVIAITLVVLLQRRRSRYKSTDSVVKRLIMYSISTGMITGIWSIVGLAGAIAMPASNLDVFINLVVPKLYVNCMLASLNSRASLRDELANGSARGKTIQLSTFHADTYGTADGSGTAVHNNPSQREIEVKVAVDIINEFDGQESFGRSSSKV